VLYAAHFTDKVAAYVGSGQLGGCLAATGSASYAFALAAAERPHNRKAPNMLRAIAPYPVSSLFEERFWVKGRSSAAASWEVGRLFLAGPELSLVDLPQFRTGSRSLST
jgi:hypothetical protein